MPVFKAALSPALSLGKKGRHARGQKIQTLFGTAAATFDVQLGIHH